MSITFIGNGIREFQEAGYITITPLINIVIRLDINLAEMTGIHPTLETITGQLILLCIYAIGSAYVLVYHQEKNKKLLL